MNPPDQSTPRTQAVWKTHCGFSNEDEATEAVCDFRDLSNTLETELAAAKAECDLNRTRLASIFWSGAMDKFTGGDVQKWAADYTAELARLRAEVQRQSRVNAEVVGEASRQVAASDNLFREARAEVERLKGALALGQQNCDDAYDDLREERDEAIARAEKAEAERAALAKDKARLNWLEKNWIHWPITQNEETIRAAIDAAMKGTT
jgi:DNA repair exonuclease SbcCD ATPase subunit